MRIKYCTHCGRHTHRQPQDFNHDTGHGHCYKCLNSNWYEYEERVNEHIKLSIWHELPRCSDDSHAKVIELFKHGKLTQHSTVYMPINKILNQAFKDIDKGD